VRLTISHIKKILPLLNERFGAKVASHVFIANDSNGSTSDLQHKKNGDPKAAAYPPPSFSSTVKMMQKIK
jgi:hypothetical protein